MGNFYVTPNAQYEARSMEELREPFKLYKDEYDAKEKELQEIDAEALTSLLSETKDPAAYKRLQGYLSAMDEASSDLATNGLHSASRTNLNKLKSMHKMSIIPMTLAAAKREELQNTYRTALAQDGSLLSEYDPYEISIDTLIANPSANYGRTYSGRQLMDDVGKTAEVFAKRILDGDEAAMSHLRATGVPYTYMYNQDYGATVKMVEDAIEAAKQSDSTESRAFLAEVLNTALDNSGIGRIDKEGNNVGEGWADNKMRKRAFDYAAQGLYRAIGPTAQSQIVDSFSMSKALREKEQEKEAEIAIQQAETQLEMEVGQIGSYDVYLNVGDNKDLFNELSKLRKEYKRYEGKAMAHTHYADYHERLKDVLVRYNVVGKNTTNPETLRKTANELLSKDATYSVLNLAGFQVSPNMADSYLQGSASSKTVQVLSGYVNSVPQFKSKKISDLQGVDKDGHISVRVPLVNDGISDIFYLKIGNDLVKINGAVSNDDVIALRSIIGTDKYNTGMQNIVKNMTRTFGTSNTSAKYETKTIGVQ